MVSDLRSDLGVPDLPVFMPSYMNDEELLKAVWPHVSDEELRTIRNADHGWQTFGMGSIVTCFVTGCIDARRKA